MEESDDLFSKSGVIFASVAGPVAATAGVVAGAVIGGAIGYRAQNWFW